MRYYIYLDKNFLRNIFSVLGDENFNIEVVEFSVRKSTTFNNQASVSPFNEKFCETGNEISISKEKDCQKRCKESNLKKDGLRGEIGCGNSSTIETHRRFINIEDITEMKNKSFYHNLIKKLDSDLIDKEKIIIEEGFIKNIESKTFITKDDSQGFFEINNKYVWYNKELLDGDIKLIMQMSCEVKVIGYRMSCMNSGKIVIKAIAIFLE